MSIKGSAESYVKLRGSLSIPTAIVGKSAYEVAVANGFDGTEEEWLASLKGGTGETGASGVAVEFKKTATHIQWKYINEAETAWRDLVALKDIKGERGAQGNAVVVYKFNDDLDESTFPEGRHYLYFNFETFDPVEAYDPNGDVERRAFKGISYGYDEGDEGGYYIAYITEDDLYAFVNSYSGNDTTAKFEDKAAMSIKVDTTNLPAEAEAFLNANARALEPLTLDSDIGKLDARVSGIENELRPPKSNKYTFNETLSGDWFDCCVSKPIFKWNELECYGLWYDAIEGGEGGNDDLYVYIGDWQTYYDDNGGVLYNKYDGWHNGAPITIELLVDFAELPEEVKAFFETNTTLEESLGLSERVTALEKKIAELEARIVALEPHFEPQTYILNEVLDLSMFGDDRVEDVFEFEVNNLYFDGEYFTKCGGLIGSSEGLSCFYWGDPDEGCDFVYYADGECYYDSDWDRKITLLSEPTTDEFKAFFEANATKVD